MSSGNQLVYSFPFSLQCAVHCALCIFSLCFSPVECSAVQFIPISRSQLHRTVPHIIVIFSLLVGCFCTWVTHGGWRHDNCAGDGLLGFYSLLLHHP